MQSRSRRFLVVAGAAGLIVLLAVLLLRDDSVSLTVGEPQVVSASQLKGFAEGVDHAVYWVGERPDTEYELTETEAGRIYVRYLPAGRDSDDGELLTVGTYPVRDGAAALRRAADQGEGRELGRSDGGAVILIDPEAPGNAHLAHPGEDLQVEVFSPVPGEALRIAARDQVRPVS